LARDRSLDVAVTGVSARFPGSPDLDGWWSALLAGRVLTSRYRRDELLAAGVPPRLADDPAYVPVRGHLDRAEHFDNQLFRISPREAELMDPQHRLMLEMAWAALEDAAMAPGAVPLRTGVFASATGSGYLRAVLAHSPLDPATLDDLIHGTEPDFMASRISYKLGLTGPALAIQTACSSSLVAVHFAVQSLLNGDCEQALVVAAGLDFPQAGYLSLPGAVQSPSGRCLPFTQDADGVVAGSGVACVVLRPLADALADGPEPYGVILGTAVNNDGAAKIGYYATSAPGQEAAISAALRVADVDAGSIGYLESHGTGTRIGDPIEWTAASAALSRAGARPGQVAVGALKASIGHLDAAAGLAALIKALWVLRTGVIPPVAGFTRLNPLLESEGSPLYIPAGPAPWPAGQPRRAGVSAFGIGGTNAHAIVEASPVVETSPVVAASAGEPRDRLIVLSAADPGALRRAASRLACWLRETDPDLGDVAFTLARGRVTLTHRLAVTGRTTAQAAGQLEQAAGQLADAAAGEARQRPAVYLFPGQGSQYPGMARPYLDSLPGFRDALDRCLDHLDRIDGQAGARVRGALLDEDFPASEVNETELAQPALFALGYAVAAGLAEAGVRPAAVVGHSAGEIAAATVAGVLDLADAAAFITVRGQAMAACAPGAMLALGCDAERARQMLAGSGTGLEVAAVNGPDSCVVSGRAEDIESFRLGIGDALFTRRLRSTRAFHSRLIDPAIPRLARALSAVVPRPPTVPIGMNVSGEIVPAGADVPAGVFAEQARRPVLFGDAIAAIAGVMPDAVAVEVGPGRALSAMAEAAGLAAVSLGGARGSVRDDAVLASLGTLWTLGQPVAVGRLCGPARRLHLPAYPFAGPRWIAPQITAPVGADAEPAPARETVPAEEPAIPDPRTGMRVIWSDLLGYPDLTDGSDFFDLGGDSLLFTRLARRVSNEFRIEVPVRAMLAARTLGKQRAIVEQLVAARNA